MVMLILRHLQMILIPPPPSRLQLQRRYHLCHPLNLNPSNSDPASSPLTSWWQASLASARPQPARPSSILGSTLDPNRTALAIAPRVRPRRSSMHPVSSSDSTRTQTQYSASASSTPRASVIKSIIAIPSSPYPTTLPPVGNASTRGKCPPAITITIIEIDCKITSIRPRMNWSTCVCTF